MATQIDTTTVTAEQIGKAHKVYGPDSKPFYMVENSKEEFNAEEKLIEYKVTYSLEFGYQCTCDAGQEGFIHCQNYCWHVRSAVAAAKEEREAMREQDHLNAEQATRQALYRKLGVEYASVDTETLKRVAERNAATKPAKRLPPLQSRGFSLLK